MILQQILPSHCSPLGYIPSFISLKHSDLSPSRWYFLLKCTLLLICDLYLAVLPDVKTTLLANEHRPNKVLSKAHWRHSWIGSEGALHALCVSLCYTAPRGADGLLSLQPQPHSSIRTSLGPFWFCTTEATELETTDHYDEKSLLLHTDSFTVGRLLRWLQGKEEVKAHTCHHFEYSSLVLKKRGWNWFFSAQSVWASKTAEHVTPSGKQGLRWQTSER